MIHATIDLYVKDRKDSEFSDSRTIREKDGGKRMTREEAIKHGEEQLEIFGGEHAELIRMAIEALKQSERKRGKWVTVENPYYPSEKISVCSVCGYTRE